MRERLERYQVGLYLLAVGIGLWVGAYWGSLAEALTAGLWPLLGALLYATFTQVPLVGAWRRLARTRLLAAALVGNFLVIPLLLWGLAQLPLAPPVLLGILLVLLVPCTDWFLVFTHLGGGDTPAALALTPLSLLLQLLLLPVYLWWFLDQAALAGLLRQELLGAFVGLILLPLGAAWLTERWAGSCPSERRPGRQRLVAGLGWLPVPLLALVLFLVAAGQVGVVSDHSGLLLGLVPLFAAFLGVALGLAWLLSRAFRLPAAQGRVLAFGFGSRNSFVVLPLALALPAGFEATVSVVVIQSLVELLGMLLFLRWVPRLFPIP
ncbi:arsenic resistance protein [Halomonas salifodinae]|uniref:arsenic resistance protein n=1 Tax=Halomonas salifodinae TaxID=438745 RepID=UPI0033A65F10